ncbi:hypothetical protein [Mycolicibacterium sp.]|uniref:hypothetical protein n=1 Tax=Mycolicibacterium sp. TaxID=2320850 RepID=UPI0025F1BF92|nr:hypothetical protein [Mycolicibacterium sp.]MCB9410332.1 hypothetical protein [Mycolicibacterium sp.]
MSETTGTTQESAGTSGSPDFDHRDRRLHRALAWVGIVAGVVFIVAAIFFSGFVLGRASDGHHSWKRGYHSSQISKGPMGEGGCPMMREGGMKEPGMKGPGANSDGTRPGRMAPAVPGAPPGR